MSDPQESLSIVLERYRNGRNEAAYTVQLLEGLHSRLDPEAKSRLLNFLWSEVSTDFKRAINGQATQHWIFPVAIPFWAKFGDTAVMTKALLGMLVADEPTVAKAWVVHLSGFLCDALQRQYNRFAEPTIAGIQAYVGDLKFAINAGIDSYQLEADLVRAVNRISQILEDKRSEPIEQELLATSNAAQSSAKLEGPPALGSGALVRARRDYSDPIPMSLEEIDKDIDYWTGRLGEGESGSNHEYWVSTRLTKLRHARARLLENKKATQGDDRKFASLAIEEARKSVAEDDGCVHPKVGAIVVKDGCVLAVAHRGELAGCHAEYIALEKKLADTSLPGATVYTTLEPCTTRNHPKIPCASRVVERRVARVVIGMLDPNPAISGKGLLALREGRITTELFPAELMEQIEDMNREFIRVHKQVRGGSEPPKGVGERAKAPDPILQKRLSAAEVLWSVALDLRERLSAAVFFYTILVPSEYDSVFEQDGKTRDLVTSITDELIADSMRRTNRVENERPYLGEVLWSLFFIYRAFLGRLAALIVMGKRRCHIDNWREDPGVHQILGGVFKEKELEGLLGSKEDLRAVYRVLDLLQSLMVSEIRSVSSGE